MEKRVGYAAQHFRFSFFLMPCLNEWKIKRTKEKWKLGALTKDILFNKKKGWKMSEITKSKLVKCDMNFLFNLILGCNYWVYLDSHVLYKKAFQKIWVKRAFFKD